MIDTQIFMSIARARSFLSMLRNFLLIGTKIEGTKFKRYLLLVESLQHSTNRPLCLVVLKLTATIARCESEYFALMMSEILFRFLKMYIQVSHTPGV